MALAELDVLAERNDRDVDVAVLRRGGLELLQQALGRGLERFHLAVVPHRPCGIEGERDAEPGVAPLRGRLGAERHLLDAHQTHEIRLHGRGRRDDDLAAARPSCNWR